MFSANNNPNNQDQRNLVLAMVLSAVILVGSMVIFPEFLSGPQPPTPETQGQVQQPPATVETAPPTSTGGEAAVTAIVGDRATVLGKTLRVAVQTPSLKGSINLAGGRLDDLVLVNYRNDVKRNSGSIELLSPSGAAKAYYVDFGWSAAATVPDAETVWQTDGANLTPETPVTLTWNNGQGLRFSRRFEVDENFLFTVTDKVENSGTATVTLEALRRVTRVGTPPTEGFIIMHEGMIGVLGDTLKEIEYDDIDAGGDESYESQGGWLGITDKYWLVALLLNNADAVKATFSHDRQNDIDIYRTEYRAAPASLAPGAAVEAAGSVFAGAKDYNLVEEYGTALNLPLFNRAVDFSGYLGLFGYMLALPIFKVLDFIYGVVGNFGISIMLLTVIVKLLVFPLANKSYRAMNKMKDLAPEMRKLQERFKDDRPKLHQATMEMYKREKVNPAAGCLPILVQIPIFIALYQVLFVTIEMRHAPFFGWIQDLSTRDPTSVLNLFGLLPWAIPDLGPLNFLSLGVWPLVMGVSMFLQQKMNPPPPDPVQAKIMMLLPIVFTFMLAPFAAGLVIYWAWNNTLSILQQWALKRLDRRRPRPPVPATAGEPATALEPTAGGQGKKKKRSKR